METWELLGQKPPKGYRPKAQFGPVPEPDFTTTFTPYGDHELFAGEKVFIVSGDSRSKDGCFFATGDTATLTQKTKGGTWMGLITPALGTGTRIQPTNPDLAVMGPGVTLNGSTLVRFKK